MSISRATGSPHHSLPLRDSCGRMCPHCVLLSGTEEVIAEILVGRAQTEGCVICFQIRYCLVQRGAMPSCMATSSNQPARSRIERAREGGWVHPRSSAVSFRADSVGKQNKGVLGMLASNSGKLGL